MTEPKNSTLKRFFEKKNNRLIVSVVAVCLLALIAGVVMDIILHNQGKIGDGEFKHRMLFILNSLGGMSIIFFAELLFRMRFPLFLEVASVVFAFAATGLATVYGFYDLIYEWDSILHTVSGCLFAIAGLSVASLVFRDKLDGAQRAVAFVLFALFFSLTIGYVWEIFEYTLDSILPNSDLQPYDVGLMKNPDGTFATVEIEGVTYYYSTSMRGTGLLDTMRDMIVHLIGSLVVLVPAIIVFLKKPTSIHTFDVTIYPWWNKRGKENPKE